MGDIAKLTVKPDILPINITTEDREKLVFWWAAIKANPTMHAMFCNMSICWKYKNAPGFMRSIFAVGGDEDYIWFQPNEIDDIFPPIERCYHSTGFLHSLEIDDVGTFYVATHS